MFIETSIVNHITFDVAAPEGHMSDKDILASGVE
jgi:hypothetical protein